MLLNVRLLLLAAVLLTVPSIARAQTPEQKDRCVVLISLDGLANFYLDDPKADLPTLRSLIKTGVRAEGTVCTFPTVTWPNHTTMVTGAPASQHGVIGNTYWDRKDGKKVTLLADPELDKDVIVKTPTIYDVAHQAGLKTAAVIWPATRNAKTLDLTVPDMAKDGWQRFGTPSWMEEMRQAGLPVDKHGAYCADSAGGGVLRDWLYTRVADHALKNHSPNLLLVHLIEADHVQHQYGPQTPEAYWAVKFVDDRLRDLIESVRTSKLADKTTLVIVSDHGFLPISREIRPNVLLKKTGLLTLKGNDVETRSAWCVSNGGGCMVYLLDKDKLPEVQKSLPELMGSLEGVEGVEAVITPDKYEEFGLSHLKDDPNAPDFWLSAASGYSFSEATAGDDLVAPRASVGGTHGYRPNQPPLHGTLVLNGYGIREGGNLPVVSNMDIAPTIAHLLGINMPTAKGKVLKDALK